MLENYAFISDDVMAYFKRRLAQAPRDADFALDYIKAHAKTRAEQDACVNAVQIQMQRAVGAARRAASRLCRGHDPAGSLRSAGVTGSPFPAWGECAGRVQDEPSTAGAKARAVLISISPRGARKRLAAKARAVRTFFLLRHSFFGRADLRRAKAVR